jgi:GalNAc-alpha-(1->4)-GalNAc-alpha-(1->3)-diNAcBac-PP-undecaprenol alpha-1,4-N-acetyl-D-galactosaminyltransferase
MIGGSELNALKLSKFINYNFYWLSIIYHQNKFLRKYDTILNFYSLKKNSIFNIFANLIFIFKIIKKNNVSTIYAIGFLPSLYSSIVKFFIKINLITTRRGKGNEEKKYFFLFYQVINLFSNTIETNSRVIFNDLKKNLLTRKKIVLIQNIIPNYIFNNKKNKKNKKNKNITIGILSNLRPVKNPVLLRDVIEKICNSKNNIIFKIVGRDYLKTYSNLTKKFANKIFWRKHMFNEQIYSFYKSIDILLITSFYESSPNIIYEAFSNGVPVVSTPNPGSKGLIKNYYNGFISNDFSTKNIVKGLNIIISDLSSFSKNSNNTFNLKYSFDKNLKKILKYL